KAERDAKRKKRAANLAIRTNENQEDDFALALKRAKTRYQTLHSQWKQATAALQRAQKHQPADYSEQETMIAKLAEQAEAARAQVTALMEQAKENIATSVTSLGTFIRNYAHS